MGTRIKANERVNYVENSQFVLDRKYTDLKLIGKGSYGVVCKAKDSSKGMAVAIKKITPMAKTVVDAKHVLREVRIMRHMGRHENIITIEDIVVREANDELYIIMELFDSDLHQVIQSSQVLTEQHHRHFMHQLMCGVKYLHDNRIIHRDLKPGNLLVSRSCALRITDFGLARERAIGRPRGGDDPGESIDEPMTEHVITRWYRPPELMLCPDGLYTYAVDIWSCGCIFAEILKRKALFPGKNFIDQLSQIFDVIGSPNALEVAHIENQEALKFLDSQKKKTKVQFHKFFPGVPTPAVTLIEGMLQFDPSNRLVINEILLSTYFQNVPRTSQSMVFPPTAPDFNFDFERQNLTKHQLRQLIVAEQGLLQRAREVTAGDVSKERRDSDINVESSRPGRDRDETATGGAAAKNRPSDGHLPKSKYGEVLKETRADQRRGSRGAAGITEDASDVLKPRSRNNSNPRGGLEQQRDPARPVRQSSSGASRQNIDDERDQPEHKRSSSGIRPRHSGDKVSSAAARHIAAPKEIKAPLVVAGHVLDDDDEEDAAIEEDYKRAKSWLDQKNNAMKINKQANRPAAKPPSPEKAMPQVDSDEEEERAEKLRKYQEYQLQLQHKYQKADAVIDIAGDIKSSSLRKETSAKEEAAIHRRGDFRGEDFETDFASESVLSTGPTHDLYSRSAAAGKRSTSTREEMKGYSDDSDADSVGIGPSRTVPAPVPYPSMPAGGVAAAAHSTVPPSPSRMNKHAMSLLDDAATTKRAMACIVSPAPPDDPSPSKNNVTGQSPNRKSRVPVNSMSGFGETTGAKGRQQPIQGLSGFGETTGAKGRQQSVVMSQPEASSVVPEPEHRYVEPRYAEHRSPSRREPDYLREPSIPEARNYTYDRNGNNKVASAVKEHSSRNHADIALVDHEDSLLDEKPMLRDRRVPVDSAAESRVAQERKNRPSVYDRLAQSAVPPPAREKTADEVEMEALEARLKAKRLTVPKSPKFSTMNFQKKTSGQQDTSQPPRDNRSSSAPRRNTINPNASKARLANIARRNRRGGEGSDDSSGSDDHNNGGAKVRHNSTSQNIPNYMKPRSESTGRFRR